MRVPILPQAPWSAMRVIFEVFFMLKIRAGRDDADLAMDGLQCPGEPYTISRLICRGRQAKSYAKCPSCPNRELGAEVIAIQAAPPSMPPRAEVTAPARAQAPGIAGFRVPTLPESGWMALARRIYDYF